MAPLESREPATSNLFITKERQSQLSPTLARRDGLRGTYTLGTYSDHGAQTKGDGLVLKGDASYILRITIVSYLKRRKDDVFVLPYLYLIRELK